MIALKFDWRIYSTAKIESDVIKILNLMALRLHKILHINVLLDIETGPWLLPISEHILSARMTQCYQMICDQGGRFIICWDTFS